MSSEGDAGGPGRVLHRCSPLSKPLPPGARIPRSPHRTIDVHCHLFVPAIEALVAGHPEKLKDAEEMRISVGAETVQINTQNIGPLLPRLIDVNVRLQDMDAMGVDLQVITPSPSQYYYWADEDLADAIVSKANEHVSSLCAEKPDRFLGLGTVSIQHPEKAAAQLEKIVRGGYLKGAMISTVSNGIDISDRFFHPFWQKAAELGAIIFIHPWHNMFGTRLAEHHLAYTVGLPLETTICVSKLIFGGHFDRYHGQKILISHGGGYLPQYMSRCDHAHAVRPEAAVCRLRPSEYLGQLWYDSIVYDSAQLGRLIDILGAKRILLGSDYPFDMGHYDHASLLAPFDSDIQKAILGGNAAELFGLPHKDA